MASSAYRNQIYQILITHFNKAELGTLCFTLGFSLDHLEGSALPSKAQELIAYLERRGRLSELKTAVLTARPTIVWPNEGETAAGDAAPPQRSDRWQLTANDRKRLVDLLIRRPELRTDSRREAFLEEMLAGSSRQTDIMGQIDLSGNPRQFANHLLTVLIQFGKDQPGQEMLGVLLNHLLTYVGDGPDADFLRSLFQTYPLKTNPISTRGLADVAWRGRETPQLVQEKIIGENTLRDIRLLELALDASRAVVRIVTTNGLGSGFLVAPGLVMTNHHVIRTPADAQPCAYQFFYQLDKDLKPLPVLVARAKPNGRFYTNPDLDVTLVELLDVPDSVKPLTLKGIRAHKDDRVNIIQHPSGHYKKISMQNNFVAFADTRTLQYLTSTQPGSSGSPIFNDEFDVIGIHHSGGHMPEPGGEMLYERNAGSSMIAILDALRREAPDLFQQIELTAPNG